MRAAISILETFAWNWDSSGIISCCWKFDFVRCRVFARNFTIYRNSRQKNRNKKQQLNMRNIWFWWALLQNDFMEMRACVRAWAQAEWRQQICRFFSLFDASLSLSCSFVLLFPFTGSVAFRSLDLKLNICNFPMHTSDFNDKSATKLAVRE